MSILFTTLALALLAVAFATENWIISTVDRDAIRQASRGDPNENTIMAAMDSAYIYFTRHRGLFRTCFPGEDPKIAVCKYFNIRVCYSL